MAGNAHANRNRRRLRCKGCADHTCKYLTGNFKNKNGHRRNPSRNKKQKKAKINLNLY